MLSRTDSCIVSFVAGFAFAVAGFASNFTFAVSGFAVVSAVVAASFSFSRVAAAASISVNLGSSNFSKIVLVAVSSISWLAACFSAIFANSSEVNLPVDLSLTVGLTPNLVKKLLSFFNLVIYFIKSEFCSIKGLIKLLLYNFINLSNPALSRVLLVTLGASVKSLFSTKIIALAPSVKNGESDLKNSSLNGFTYKLYRSVFNAIVALFSALVAVVCFGVSRDFPVISADSAISSSLFFNCVFETAVKAAEYI